MARDQPDGRSQPQGPGRPGQGSPCPWFTARQFTLGSRPPLLGSSFQNAHVVVSLTCSKTNFPLHDPTLPRGQTAYATGQSLKPPLGAICCLAPDTHTQDPRLGFHLPVLRGPAPVPTPCELVCLYIELPPTNVFRERVL